MTEADKMFEELGYKRKYFPKQYIENEKKIDYSYGVFYYELDNKDSDSIIFYDSKKVAKMGYVDEEWITKPITMQELKAIYKKCEEKGWLAEPENFYHLARIEDMGGSKMVEINVNEYVRTKNGCIEKVTQIDELYIDEEGEIEIVVGDNIEGASVYDIITKHSFNIIDLIEVGDYVNGDKVIKKLNDYLMVGTEFINQGISNELVETVVTKEQFKSMEYKVGDDEI